MRSPNNRYQVVAVTGASGYIGSRLLQELEAEEQLERVVAIDTRPMPVPFHNCASERIDVTEPLDGTFHEHGVNTVVHLASIMRPGRSRRERESIRQANLKGVQSVLHACRAAGVKNLIYLSSHTVYGAHRDSPVPITEDVGIRPSRGFQYSYDKVQCESEVQQFAWDNPEVSVTVLRSCVVMGPGADNYVTRAFSRPLLVGVWGHDPPLQFVHEDDLAKVFRLLIMDARPGTFNVAGEGVVRYSQLARLCHSKLIFLPPVVAYPMVQMAWNLGIQKDAPAAGLDFVRHPIILSTDKLKEATGFRFFYTSEEALASAFLGGSTGW